MPSLIRLLAVREVTSHRLRSLLTSAGVAIGAAVVVAVLALNASVIGGFQDMVDALAGGADLQVRGAQGGIPADSVETVRAIKGVASAGAFVEKWLLDPLTNERILCVGVDFLADEPAPGLIDAGALNQDAMANLVEDPFQFLNSTDAMLINADYAARLKLRRGDSRKYVTPTGEKTLKVAGILSESAATRALGGAVAVMSVDAASLVVGSEDKVDVINIRIEKSMGVDQVRRNVRKILGNQYTVEEPARRGQRLARMLRTITTVMRVISVVAILVGIFIVSNTLGSAVRRRRREIAIQRALGITRMLSGAMVVIEAALLGLIGGIVGAPLGLALASGAISVVSESISALYAMVRPRPPTLSTEVLLLVGFGAVLSACLAALHPARRAGQVPPAMVLAARGTTSAPVPARHSVAVMVLAFLLVIGAYVAAQLPNPHEEPWWGHVACLLLLAAGALVAQPALYLVQWIAVSVVGKTSLPLRLGAEGLTRDASRAGQTASALMVGLALFIGVSGWVGTVKTSVSNWLDASVPSDLSIVEGSALPDAQAVPMDPAVGEKFAQDPDVERVFRQRFRTIDIGEEVTRFQAIDMRAFFTRGNLPVVSAVGPVNADVMEAGEVLISENLSNLMGLHAGDMLELPTTSGARPMRIRAVIIDYTSDIGAVWIDWSVYAKLFEDPKVDSFSLYLRKGADTEAVRSRLLALHGGSTLRVVSHESLKGYVNDLIDSAFAATRALELIALLIALMGIINTLFAAVLDRIREIGVLRAIGATRGQIISMLGMEALLLGVTAAVLASGVGVAFGYVFTNVVAAQATGWRLDYIAPLWTIGEAFVLAMLVAAVAAAAPARMAANIDIIVATRVE